MFPSGLRGRGFIFVPLLALLTFGAPAAAQLPSYEKAWRASRAAMDRGELAEAMRVADEALARAGKSDEEWVWALRIQKATLLILNARLDDAAAILDAPLPAKLRTTAVAARRLLTRAMLEWYRNPASRGKGLDEALAIARKHAPSALAEILWLTGKEQDVREAIQLGRKHGEHVVAAKAEASLVFTLANTQRWAEAIEIGEPLLARLQSLGVRSTHAKHAGNLGWIHSEVGGYDRSVELLSFAVTELGRIGNFNDQRVFFATLSNVHLLRRDWQSAVRAAQDVIAATAGMQHRSRGHAFSSLAGAYVELGRPREAREAVRQALALETDANDRLITRIVEARIDIAEAAYDRAANDLLRIAGDAMNPQTRLAAQSQLARAYAAGKQPQAAERAFRGAVALVHGARESINSMEARLSFFNTASELFDDYVDFLVAAGRVEDALRVTETSRAQTLAEGLDLDEGKPLDPKKLASARNATILCYWLGRQRSYVWTITPNDIRLATLRPDTDIESAVARYGDQLLSSAGTLERSAARGQALFAMLVPRGAHGRRVIVVPDGRLHTLNFETLVTPAKKYWLEDVVLSNASSLQLLARGGASAKRAPRMLLVGNPPQADAAFPPLTHAGDEIQRIEKRFPGRATVLAGPRATPAAYKAAKPEAYDFVHFVAHGVAARTKPLDSAVILAHDATRKYRLDAREIAQQPLDARLVTISSCHGAGTATYAGEGLVGLAWAFLNAGAQQVVAALWAVKDSAAPRLMDHFYAGLASGRDPAVALRDAKLALLRSKTSQQHAKYWAPFVIYQ